MNLEVNRMLRKLLPRFRVNTIYDIALIELWDSGFRGIITDLDNTLVGAGEPMATPRLLIWLEQVKALGFQVVIVSNNDENRVSKFAAPLNLPFIHRAKKPTTAAFHKALQLMKLSI